LNSSITRAGVRLDWTSRLVKSTCSLIGDGVSIPEADETQSDLVRRRRLGAKIVEQIEDVGVDVVGVAGIDHHLSTRGNAGEGLHQGGAVQEAHLVGELDPEHVPADVILDDSMNRPAEIAAQDEGHRNREAEEDADEQVGEQDRDHRKSKRQKLIAALVPHLAHDRRGAELHAGSDENGGERGERYAIERGRKHEDAEEEEHAVDNRREFGASTGIDVHRAADDDRRHGQSAEKRGDDVAGALREQLPVRGGVAAFRIELIDRFEVQEGLERGDDRRGNRTDPNRSASSGACTRWDSSIRHGAPNVSRDIDRATPPSTTSSGAGTTECFSRLLSHANRNARDARPMIVAPGWRAPSDESNSVKVFWSSS
jgi:hypothetical protein